MKVKQSEKDIETLILTWLNYQPGCFAFKMNIMGVWDQRGFHRRVGKFVPVGGADVIGLVRGRFIALEIKTPAAHKKLLSNPGEHEQRQLSFLKQVVSKGGIAGVVSTLEQVQMLITQSEFSAVHTPLVLT